MHSQKCKSELPYPPSTIKVQAHLAVAKRQQHLQKVLVLFNLIAAVEIIHQNIRPHIQLEAKCAGIEQIIARNRKS